MATEPTSNKKKLEYVPSAQFGFTDVDKEKDTVYKMTDAVNKTGRFLADQAQQYRLTESNGSAKAWTAVNVGDITKFFTGVRVGLFHVNPTDVSKMTDKAGLPVAYQSQYFMAEFNTVQGSDARVTIYPRVVPATALPITTIWYNQVTGKVNLTEGRSSDATNDLKYQVHKLTADNGATTSVDNQDWNTLKSTGLYYCNPAGANAPVPKGHLILEVLSIDNNANISQRATETVSNRVFKRGLVGGNWTAWALQATTDYVDNKVKTAVDAGQSYPLTKETGEYKYSFSETSNIETEFAKQPWNNGTVYISGGNPFIKSALGGQPFFGSAQTLDMRDVGYLIGMTRPGRIWINVRGGRANWKGWKQLGTMDDITGSQNMLQGKINATQMHKLTMDNGSSFAFPEGKTLNTLMEVGTYYGVAQSDPSNPTPGSGNYKVEVTSIQNNTPKMQELTDVYTGQQYWRLWVASAWKGWHKRQLALREVYKIPIITSLIKQYGSEDMELTYVNGVVTLSSIMSPGKVINSGDDPVTIANIADARYRPTRSIHVLQQGSGSNVYVLSVGQDGGIGISRHRSMTTSNLAFGKGDWLNMHISYTPNDTHA